MKRLGKAIIKLGLVGIVVVLLAGGGLFYYGKTQFEAAGPTAPKGADETVILLPKGIGVRAICKKLEAEGLISDARLFEIGIRLQKADTRLKAGEYGIKSGASMAEISEILQSGKSILHKITIPEGLTSAQIIRLIVADPVLTGKVDGAPEEGALLPETYLFTRGMTREQLVLQMRTAHDELLMGLWDQRAENLPFDTKEEAVILASIVEKETGVSAERPRVASVFVNRLRRGIRLQSDPTVIYGLTGGEPLRRGIRRSELDRVTDYNTYIVDGLPPTPIANPGRASLQAVLQPAETKDLYFVADGTGGHVFASTLSQHQRNVAKWRRIERERKSK